MEINDSSARKIYLDYLRVFATFAVIMLHIAAQNWYSYDVSGGEWRTLNFYDSIVRWGVPVFVMISGALFLNREEIPLKKILNKYVKRLLIAYIVWNFVYYLFEIDATPLQKGVALFQPNSVENWIRVIKGDHHMWFIPMIVGVYLCIPILHQIVKNEIVMRYYLCLSVVFWFVIPQAICIFSDFGSEEIASITKTIGNVFQNMHMGFVQNYVFYFILGYEMSKVKVDKKVRIVLYVLGSVGFVFTIAATQILSLKLQEATGNYYDESRLNVLLEAIAVFELFKNIPFKKNAASRIMRTLSIWSFGVYLVHMLLIRRLVAYGLMTFSSAPIVEVPGLALIVFLCGTAISAALHYVPVLKKYIV